MKIAILDQDQGRAIIATVPDYLADANASSETIAFAIFEALGLQQDTEYMIGEFDISVDLDSLNGGRGYGDNVRKLDEFTGSFKDDALEALNDLIG